MKFFMLLAAIAFALLTAPALAQREGRPEGDNREPVRPADEAVRQDAPFSRPQPAQRQLRQPPRGNRPADAGRSRSRSRPVSPLTLVGQLDLSDEQRQQIQQLISDERERVTEHREQIREIRRRADAARRAGDDEAQRAAFQELQQHIRQPAGEGEDMLEQVREILTEQQNRELSLALAERDRSLRNLPPERGGPPRRPVPGIDTPTDRPQARPPQAPRNPRSVEQLQTYRRRVAEHFEQRQRQLEQDRDAALARIDRQIRRMRADEDERAPAATPQLPRRLDRPDRPAAPRRQPTRREPSEPGSDE